MDVFEFHYDCSCESISMCLGFILEPLATCYLILFMYPKKKAKLAPLMLVYIYYLQSKAFIFFT